MQLAIYHHVTSAVWADALFVSVIQGSDRPDASQVRKAIAAAVRAYGGRGCAQRVAQDFGDSPAVILRSVPELLRIGRASPYAKKGADPARHHVTFLAERPDRKTVASLVLPPSGRDELVVEGREVYVHTPDGYSNSKLTGTLLERRLGVLSTTRNWNTVTKLCALAGEQR